MRRAFLLLIALVLSSKAVAAGVVPIVGAPGHRHATSMEMTQPDASTEAEVHAGSAAHMGCSGHPTNPVMPDGGLHEHACPHLGMASAVVSVPCLEPQQYRPIAPAYPVVRFTSVDHDVPSPPPTSLASFG